MTTINAARPRQGRAMLTGPQLETLKKLVLIKQLSLVKEELAGDLPRDEWEAKDAELTELRRVLCAMPVFSPPA